jgi:hypothetical protein
MNMPDWIPSNEQDDEGGYPWDVDFGNKDLGNYDEDN